MPRPPLPIGSWGRISTSIRQTDKNGKPVSHRSSARFRDHDGQVRPVTAYGKTPTAAERALLKKLQDGPPVPARPGMGHGRGQLAAAATGRLR
jgi:hypothetical protein